MPLPDLIEIVPLTAPVRAEITVPGSKSITNRALVLAALADGEVALQGALWSEDTQVMVDCLQEFQHALDVGDVRTIEGLFEKAKQRRDAWCAGPAATSPSAE